MNTQFEQFEICIAGDLPIILCDKIFPLQPPALTSDMLIIRWPSPRIWLAVYSAGFFRSGYSAMKDGIFPMVLIPTTCVEHLSCL